MPASKKYINTCLSFVYARYTYRDTDLLEDKHASGEKLDMKFYESIVDLTKIRYYEIHQVITDNFCGVAPRNDKEKDLVAAVALYTRTHDHWDPPEKVRNRFEGTVVGFVLDGEFLKACKLGLSLSDELMKTINKDICNRYYTLLSRGIITHELQPEIVVSEDMSYSDFRDLFKVTEDFEMRFGKLSEEEAHKLISKEDTRVFIKACMMTTWSKCRERLEKTITH